MSERMSPVTARVRAYFAAVSRPASETAGGTLFDPAQSGSFALDAPPAPWVDLGWIAGFTRRSGTRIEAVRSGAPAVTQVQARTEIEATVALEFESWGKLQLALAAGTQQMNLLKPVAGAAAEGSGGAAVAAVALESTPVSTAMVLEVGAAAANFAVGEMVAVDVDYTGQTGFVGSGVSGAYVRTALGSLPGAVDYVRRVTLNVGRIAGIANGALTLECPLAAGAPTAAMKVSAVVGFCDREGSSFFQEWSGLFVAEGQQGERVIWHYPRLQTMGGIAEAASASPAGYERLRLSGSFRALPVKDPVDGETVVCFRSYVAG